jgi:uncharacterized protein Yka (UPF0111/DUF47 family)
MATNPFLQWFQSFGQPAEAVKSFEEWLAGQLDKVARSEAFLGQMGQVLGQSFQMKAQMDRLMEQSLRNLRLPTQGDVEGLHKRLDALERRLDDIEGRVGTGGPDARLDALVDRIEEVAAEVDKLQARSQPRKKTQES